jgi:hypothetical protein
MSFAEKFEDLEIWKDSRRLNKQLYFSLEHCRDYSFRDQMRRAALSVMNNIKGSSAARPRILRTSWILQKDRQAKSEA